MKKLLLSIIILLFSSSFFAQKATTDFVTTWRTLDTQPFLSFNPSSNDSSVHINIDTTMVYNYDIDWDNDGIFDTLGVTDHITHQYLDTGTFIIRIRGQFPRIVFGRDIWYSNVRKFPAIRDHFKLISIDQWGATAWEDMHSAFVECENLLYNAVDVPNLSKGPRLIATFRGCLKFNGAIGNWDVSRVKNMDYFLSGCEVFNQDLSAWNVDSVTSMSYMFFFASSFDQNLSSWNVSNVTNMRGMFHVAYDFNGDIRNWDVSSVKDMRQMFHLDSVFNQDISGWQVDSVQNFNSMFTDAVSFNQDISTWNVDSAYNMSSILQGATSFNQNLGNWDISSKFKLMWYMLDHSNLSVQNYDSTLIMWESRIPVGRNLSRNISARGLSYCLSDSIRTEMRNKAFFISGDQFDCSTVSIKEIVAVNAETSYAIYPNPNNGSFFIESFSNELNNESILVYSIQGKLVHSSVLKNQKQQVDLSNFNSGIYLVRVGNETKRLVVY